MITSPRKCFRSFINNHTARVLRIVPFLGPSHMIARQTTTRERKLDFHSVYKLNKQVPFRRRKHIFPAAKKENTIFFNAFFLRIKEKTRNNLSFKTALKIVTTLTTSDHSVFKTTTFGSFSFFKTSTFYDFKLSSLPMLYLFKLFFFVRIISLQLHHDHFPFFCIPQQSVTYIGIRLVFEKRPGHKMS